MSVNEETPLDITTAFGFDWGPVRVERRYYIKGRGYVVDVNGVEIYVSEEGRSVRVFRRSVEWKEAGK